MKNQINLLVVSAFAIGLVGSAADSPFNGSWAFRLPDASPAWLQLTDSASGPEGKLLWSVGNPRSIRDVKIEGENLSFAGRVRWKPYLNSPDRKDVRQADTIFVGRILDNGLLELRFHPVKPFTPGQAKTYVLKGKKNPPMPPAPNLAKARFGKPIRLFNGKDLSGWRLHKPGMKNGWRAENGILINETPKTDFGGYGDHGNLITVRKFHDFRLSIEYNVGKERNSGIYLRGMYEAQVVDRDSRMQGIAGPGAIFGRIKPTENAGKVGGEWNSYVITLVDRHITVILNGKKVIDNHPVEGCTGGGISADDSAAGPILLQGDHTDIRYRNIVIEPVMK